MAVSERRKGLRGQQQVQQLFRVLGFELDKLAGQGDRVFYAPNGVTVRLEVKHQKRVRISEWIDQSEDETPQGMIAAVVWKRPGGRWRIDMDAEDLIGLVS